jgi:signal transduction histidine kinase
LFDPFVTTKAEGLGLGLSIARTVVETHGGQIWAENGEESGAMVSFLLPAVAVESDAVHPSDAAYATSSPMFTWVE